MPDASVDAAVVCLVLCSVGSVPAVLGQLRRVVRPGGEVRLLEHVCSDRLVSGFFEIVEIEPFKVFTAGMPAFPMRRLVARNPGGPS